MQDICHWRSQSRSLHEEEVSAEMLLSQPGAGKKTSGVVTQTAGAFARK